MALGFYKWTPVFEVGARKAPELFEPPTYEYTFSDGNRATGFRFEPLGFLRARARMAPEKKIEFRTLQVTYFRCNIYIKSWFKYWKNSVGITECILFVF